MTNTGFYEQKSIRPGGMALVIALHAVAFASLVLMKTDYVRLERRITDVFNVPIPPPPEPNPPPPEPRVQPRPQPSQLDTVDPIVRTQSQGPVTQQRDPPLPPFDPNAGRGIEIASASPDLPRIPVRVEAQLDPRSQLQPPYPASMEAREIEGTVRIRLTIGPDGRVKAVERLSATNDAFWRTTQQHVLNRWRFRPATEDGRPVESTRVMNLIFRIQA